MGLWDILVPAEAGVLHNTIANPSFEYDAGEITKIYGKYSPSQQNLKYWSSLHSSVAISPSRDWASQGKTSLKIAKGITSGSNRAVQYYPRYDSAFTAPTVATSVVASGGTIGVSNITLAIMPLTDLGMSLANGITDTQAQAYSNAGLPLHAWLYPSIDSRRGHGLITYATVAVASGSTNTIVMDILDNSSSQKNVPSGYAVWYSTNATPFTTSPTAGTFQLAGVFSNVGAFMDGTITTRYGSNAFTLSDANLTTNDNNKVLYTQTSPAVAIGTISNISSATSGTFTSTAAATYDNVGFRMVTTVSINTIIASPTSLTQATGGETMTIDPTNLNTVTRSINNFAAGDVGSHIYVQSANGQYVLVGTILSVSGKVATLMGQAQFLPLNQTFWISKTTNPQSFPNNSQGSLRMFTLTAGAYSPVEVGLDCTAPYWGITNSIYGDFTKKHHLYLDWYMSADNATNPNATYTNTGADWSVYLVNNSTSTTTLLGKLDSTGTTTSAERMGLRTKFLIPRPSGNTSDMSIRIVYTGASTSDAALYIDGVQFVDVGMIWRAYDWYSNNIGTYTTPPQFSDWDWDTVEFTYIDGDTPGAMWSDNMPTQSGTYVGTFPYFTNNGIWFRDQYEFETVSANTNAGGYAGPRSWLNYRWRNTTSPIYGVSIPGLSQSSMQTQTYTTGFWAPLDTSNINVVVEPSISGIGMPEIATTSIEYGIVDGGYVQRQVARMRNMQLTVTISAQSWSGLHANRRSLINLLKFDQLSQQGERRLRYRGGGIPVFTSVTYQSGLEYSGTQGISFTEALGIRFLSTDPYFYTESMVTTDASPDYYSQTDFAHIIYKMGNNAEWLPLSHKYYATDANNNPVIAGKSFFYDDADVYISPSGLGWIQSPSGNISALVVGGFFTKPVPYLAIFYVAGHDNALNDTVNKVVLGSTTGSMTYSVGTSNFSISVAYALSPNDIGKYLFDKNKQFIGQINSITSYTGPTTGTISGTIPAYASSGSWYIASFTTVNVETMPNTVHLHNLLTVDSFIYAVYQESANSILVAGGATSISDQMTTQQPTATTNGYVSSKTNNVLPTYKNRVFRIMMNDSGKITVQAVDDVFTKIVSPTASPTSVTYKSSLYSALNYADAFNNLFDAYIYSLTKSPSNYTIIGTEGAIGLNSRLYDVSLPAAVNRGPYAMSNEIVLSSVQGIDPVGNAITIGMRQTVRGKGTITTVAYNPLAATDALKYPSASFIVQATAVAGTASPFSVDLLGRALYTVDGLYLGRVVYFDANVSAYIAYFAEPCSISLTNAPYEISADVISVAADNKSLRSSLYAATASTFSTTAYNSYVHGYFNNPTLLGNVSVIAGSRSLGSTQQIANIYGINVTATAAVTCVTTSILATVANYILSQQNVGSYVIIKSTNQYVGRIARVTSDTTFEFSSFPVIAATSTNFYLRSSLQLVDESGYTSLAGNLVSTYGTNPRVGTLEYNAVQTFSNAIVPKFIVPSVTSSGSIVTFKNPYIFSDNSTVMYMQTYDNPVGKIVRRGVFSALPRDTATGSGVKSYRTNAFGVIGRNYNVTTLDPVNTRVSAGGSISTTAGSATFTFLNNILVANDIGRSVYAAPAGGNMQFLGIIKSIGTPNNSFLNNATVTGTFTNPYVSYRWFPYQFNLKDTSTLFTDTFYSTVNQGMITSNVVNAGTTTAFTVNFCNPNIISASLITNPCLYAYLNGTWRYVGIITATTATQITIGGSGGTQYAMPASTPLAIAPAMVISSTSARTYVSGQELYATYWNITSPGWSSNQNVYLGTIQSVISNSDTVATLAVMPYSYSQATSNYTYYPSTGLASMVYVGAQQSKGSQVSNFFADVYGSPSSQSADYTSMLYSDTISNVIRDVSSNSIMPGVLRGTITTSTSSTTVTGLNTSFVATKTTSNPMNTGLVLFTAGQASGGTAVIGTINSVNTTAQTLGLSANAAVAVTNGFYRVGTGTTVSPTFTFNGQNITFDTIQTSVTITAVTSTQITMNAGAINDRWIGRAIFSSNVPSSTSFVGIVASISSTVATFETTINSAAGVTTSTTLLFVSSVPLKWMFRSGDVLRNLPSSTNVPGALLGQIRDVLPTTNSVYTTAEIIDNLVGTSPYVFAYQRGIGISMGQGVITSVDKTTGVVTGSNSYFTQLPVISGNRGARVDLYITNTTYNRGSTLVGAPFTLVGQVISVASDTSLTLTNAQFSLASGSQYSWYYVVRNIPTVGNAITDEMNATDLYTNSSSSYLNASMAGLGTIDSVVYSSVSTAIAYGADGGGTISTSFTAVNSPSTITGSGTNFSVNDIGKPIFGYLTASNSWVYLGIITTFTSVTSVGIAFYQYSAALPLSTRYTFNAVPLAKVTGANTVGASSIVPTQFTYQVCPGDILNIYDSVLSSTVVVRVVHVLSDYELYVVGINGLPLTTELNTAGSTFTIFKQTNEMAAFDSGITGYVNQDWQKLGYQNNQNSAYVLNVSSNGDVYVGGAFTSWAKQSANYNAINSDDVVTVNRVARMIIALNSYGYVTDAFGAPLAGNSYIRNGFFNGDVTAIVDSSNINPANGYIGATDTVMIGGSFTRTTDNIAISSGLGILPSSSISSTMRQIVNSDVNLLNSSGTTNVSVNAIAVSNRLRQYNGLIATNVLDGINGTNIAVSYKSTVTIGNTTKYHAIRVRGNASAYPIINVEYLTTSNASSNASKSLYSLIQTATGAKIEFVNNELLVYNGEHITIDLRLGSRSIISNLRGNLANALSPSSNFVDFILLGANNSAGLSTQSYDDYRVNVIGIHADYGLSVTISYVPRFWSFDTNNLFFGTTKAGL